MQVFNRFQVVRFSAYALIRFGWGEGDEADVGPNPLELCLPITTLGNLAVAAFESVLVSGTELAGLHSLTKNALDRMTQAVVSAERQTHGVDFSATAVSTGPVAPIPVPAAQTNE